MRSLLTRKTGKKDHHDYNSHLSMNGLARKLSLLHNGYYNRYLPSLNWVDSKVLVLLTVSQRLLILDTSTMQVTASCDLLMKQVLHHDRFSSHMTNFPAVADAYYPNFKTYKHRIMILVPPHPKHTR